MSHHKSGKLRNYTDSRQFLTSAGDNGWIFHVSWVPVATAICHNVIKVAQVSTANTFNTKELIQKITLSLTITIQHVIFMEWLRSTIHQFFKSAMQGISSLSSRWAIARASYCYVLILWLNLFQPPSIFDLQYLPINLNPASVPGPEQDSVCSVLYASRRVKTCFSIESCEEAPRDSINGALLTPPPASQPGHYIYPSANSLRQQMPPKKINYSKMDIQVS